MRPAWRFIAMEWVHGQTLRDLLAAGRLAPRRLAHLAHQIAEGLAQAHAAGVVHRKRVPRGPVPLADWPGVLQVLERSAGLQPSVAVDGAASPAA